ASRTIRDLHSFPTRRSSDLQSCRKRIVNGVRPIAEVSLPFLQRRNRNGGPARTARNPEEFDVGKEERAEPVGVVDFRDDNGTTRSEEHTSELQSRFDLVCRL